ASYAARDLVGFQGFVAAAPVLDTNRAVMGDAQVLASADEIAHAATIYQTKKALEGVDVDFTSAVVAVRDMRAVGRT
ncbi:MAG TPA: hypothetical protein VL133_02875, partial [Devosia sp.]|nr:hypothetical protein [Devosia sp.]